MARLAWGERRLGFPTQDKNRLLQEANSLLFDSPRSVLKIILTRGSGGRGYRPPATPQINRFLSLHDWPNYPSHWFTDGIKLRICNTRLGRNERLAGIKHLNRLEQVLARQEWDDPDIPEGLMLDEQGRVIEATQSNLFLLRGGVLNTPDLSKSGVAGVVRELVIEVAQEMGMKCVISTVSIEDLKSADAFFLTSSLLAICPVARLDDCLYDLRAIPQALRERVSSLALG